MYILSEKNNNKVGDMKTFGSSKPNPYLIGGYVVIEDMSVICKGRHKRESKNAKQMRNTKQKCFSHSSASPRNDKQCSAEQCFANQTNRRLASFASRSDLFRDNARLTKHRRKVNQRHLILQAMYTTM